MMMASRLVACFCFIAFGLVAMDRARADDFDPGKFNPAQFEEYERQLNAILRTRREEEKEFVARVVELIRTGEIPAKLVDTSYQWVRNKRPNTDYPFIYFERVLRLQAKQIKLDKKIPVFDYSIYGSAGQQGLLNRPTAGQRSGVQAGFTIRNAAGRSAGQVRRR